MKTSLRIFMAASLVMAALATAANAPSFVGTWKLSLEKSKFDPGPPPKSQTVIYEMSGQDFKLIVMIEDAYSQQHTRNATFRMDGKPYPMSGNPNVDTISVQRISARETRTTEMRGSKIVGQLTSTISADGKTRTSRVTLMTADGRTEHNVTVYDRQ
jgi:hypothetical protein